MINLELKKLQKFSLSDPHNIQQFIIDSSTNVLYFVSDLKLYSFTNESKKITFLQNLALDCVFESQIIFANLLVEDKFLFFIFKNGKLISYDLFNNELLEHCIDVDSEIEYATFSHDQELLTMTTQNKQMLLLNKLMVLKTNYDMNKDEYGTNEMVNVNWGSKNTQFHGEGMRDKRTVEEEYYPLNIWDDSSSVISWRGDDSYFAINFVCSKGYRMLKLFNREGILQHSSEYIPGLEKQISWKLSGTVIAASQMLPNKHKIIFFEKNGLKHGEFDLPFEPQSFLIQNLSWSCDSDILLVNGYNLEMLETVSTFKKISQNILLYTQSNYHWYIKQRLSFTSSNYIENISWDETEYSLLHLTSSSGSYYSYLFNKLLNGTTCGKVFVINSNQLNISDFDKTLIPPPMYNYSINFEESRDSHVKQLCYSSNLLFVLLANDVLSVFNLNSSTIEAVNNLKFPISYKFANAFKDFNLVYLPLFYKKVPQISEMTIPVVLENGCVYGLIDNKIAYFDYSNSETITLLCEIGQSINTLSIWTQTKLLLSNINGHLYCYDIETKTFEEYIPPSGLKILFNEACSQIFVFTDSKNQPHVIALTCNNSLYFDQALIMRSIVNSAFLYHNKYLLFTTNDNKFYCWPLENFDYTELFKSCSPRNVEKGSKLITASNAKVVVQLPRGNLEAFYPRALLLDRVENFIDNVDFLSAFEILRKNRINFNHICDYNYDLFVQHCGIFVEQIGRDHVDWICLFLSELSNDYCYERQIKDANKVDTICQHLFDHMNRIDKVKFLNPILLTYVRRQKSDVANALKEVKNLANNKMRDEAIKFLLYVINVNRLFDEALGTYDFDILLMVASKSNKDPKEYISLVNSFKEIQNDNYRKYKIDLHLERYTSSLFHLSKCEDKFAEAIQLIESKHLFKDAIEIYKLNSSPDASSEYSQIWNIYGDYLFKKKYYEEAAVVYKRACNYSQAYKMYVMSSNWNMATVCARKVTNDPAEFKKLIYSLSQQLILNGDYINGAYLLENYLENYTEAFHTLVKGHEWNRAIRCYNDHNLDHALIDNELKFELINSFNSITDLVDANLDKLTEYLARLSELKEIKQNNCDEFGCQLEADFDSYSDTSSIMDSSSVISSGSASSLQTLNTNKSKSRVKNIKRQEQRKYLLKRGSPNEDIQIVYAVKELAKNCLNLFSESTSLIKFLYDIFYVNESSSLQAKLTLLHDKLTQINDFIWNCDYYQRRLSDDELLRTPVNFSGISEWKIVLN